jgi:N-acetylneuraminate synthase
MVNDSIKVSNLSIGKAHAPFIIAEMSGNHMGSLDRAMRIIEEVSRTGAQAIKLQTYTADTMTLDIKDREFYISDPTSLWNGRSLYDLYTEAHTPWKWHKEIFEYSRSLGLIPFSTPFDASAVDFLEELNVELYKIASFENTDLDLIHTVSSTGKPVIISTGMATVSEISEAVSTARNAGCKDLVLLKCTSAYPASPDDVNLLTIPHMESLFDCQVGLSDHTLGLGVAIASIAMGATVIEKHVTLKRNDGAIDSAFSMEPEELKSLVTESSIAHRSLGKIRYGFSERENLSSTHRRSLYIVDNLKKGEVLEPRHLRAIRPGLGLPIKFRKELLGKQVNRDVLRGTPASWDLFG